MSRVELSLQALKDRKRWVFECVLWRGTRKEGEGGLVERRDLEDSINFVFFVSNKSIGREALHVKVYIWSALQWATNRIKRGRPKANQANFFEKSPNHGSRLRGWGACRLDLIFVIWYDHSPHDSILSSVSQFDVEPFLQLSSEIQSSRPKKWLLIGVLISLIGIGVSSRAGERCTGKSLPAQVSMKKVKTNNNTIGKLQPRSVVDEQFWVY